MRAAATAARMRAAATAARMCAAAMAVRMRAAAAVTAVELLPQPSVSSHSRGKKLLYFLK